MHKLNMYLQTLHKEAIAGVFYENFYIEEKQGHHYIFLGDRSKIINSAATLKQAQELCDTINSGC